MMDGGGGGRLVVTSGSDVGSELATEATVVIMMGLSLVLAPPLHVHSLKCLFPTQLRGSETRG